MIINNDKGDIVNVSPTGAYVLPIQIRQTAASVANSTVFAMRNGSTKTIYIRRIRLATSFDGTAAASTSRYDLCRFTTATPTGGTSLTPIKKISSYSASTVADARVLDTGLTTTSVVFESAFAYVANPRQNGASESHQIDFETGGLEVYDTFVLAANEGLCIRLGVAAVVGDSVTGFIEWEER